MKERIMEKLCEKVLRKITPKEKEREELLNFSRSLANKLTKRLGNCGIDAEAQVQGSVAKDTWLAEDKDIDVFIFLQTTYTKEVFPRVLDFVKAFVGKKWVEVYAEHPYVEAEVEGYKVDFVPCFRIKRAEETISSVDRTPLHTSYINTHLNKEVKNEVRLLKRFMLGINTYGAEIRVGGFSGYLCELLTLHYGSFLGVLNAFVDWKGRNIIDSEGYYKGREIEAQRIFEEPLVVIDPIDKRRNVSSAVRKEKLDEFIVAARAFLKKPCIRFFYPQEIKTFDAEELIRAMATRGSAIVFVKFGRVNTVPDILWGQLYKSKRALRKLLQRNDFSIIRDSVWSNEEDINIFVFELEQPFLPSIKKHFGPPIQKSMECDRFLQKHINALTTVSGPRLEESRWVVDTQRKHPDVTSLLGEKLRDGGKYSGVANLISQTISKKFEIFINEEILKLYSSNPNFAKFLTEYLKGLPIWLTET